jgi:hypothetical protein
MIIDIGPTLVKLCLLSTVKEANAKPPSITQKLT